MMNPAQPPPYDVENGTVTTPGGVDHTDNFTLGDDSTLQAPPSLDDHDLEDLNHDDDDGGPVHDLPTPEEYKAKMAVTNSDRSNSFVISNIDNSAIINDDDNAPVHDLPTVEDYKSSRSFNDSAKETQKNKKNRQGLWTFLILFVLTAIVTA
jgi:hypothetical protein